MNGPKLKNAFVMPVISNKYQLQSYNYLQMNMQIKSITAEFNPIGSKIKSGPTDISDNIMKRNPKMK